MVCLDKKSFIFELRRDCGEKLPVERGRRNRLSRACLVAALQPLNQTRSRESDGCAG
jgi:hypothetical protein